MHRRPLLRPGWLLALLLVAGAVVANLPAIRPVPHVDLARFMGTWYLVGGIPTAFERDAWNAVETYTLLRDGSIRTTLTFNQGRANGPRKHIEAPARVRPGTNNAVWDVRVFGPVKAQYVVAWLRDDYSLWWSPATRVTMPGSFHVPSRFPSMILSMRDSNCAAGATTWTNGGACHTPPH